MKLFNRMFDQTREGKGYGKEDVREKGILRFFDIYFTNFWKITVLSLVYCLFCLPVVTMPAATCAFVYIQRNLARSKPVFVWSDFVEVFSKNFWRALPIGIIDIVLLAVMGFSVYWYGYVSGVFTVSGETVPFSIIWFLAFAVALCCVVIYSFMRYYLYLLFVSFDFKYKQIYKNAFYLANLGFLRNTFVTFCRGLIVAVLLLLATLGSGVGIGLAIVLVPLIAVGFRGYLINYNAFAVVYKYIVKPYEEEQKKKAAESGATESDEEETKPLFVDMGRKPAKK